MPLLARFAPPVVPAAVICFCWLALSVGLLLAPGAFVIWVGFGAIAHAGGFVVIFTLLVGVARSDAEAAGMSALVQGAGYGIGALGAPLLGAVHEATGGWTVPLMIMVGVAVAYTVLLLSALAAARRTRGLSVGGSAARVARSASRRSASAAQRREHALDRGGQVVRRGERRELSPGPRRPAR